MNTEMKVTTGATETTYDIELPPIPKGDIAADTCPVIWVHSNAQLQAYARAAIEADRKRRGEPVLVGWAVGTTGGGLLHASKYTEYEARRAGYSLPLYRLTAQQPLSESDIPAEPVSRDVEALVRLLEDGEWAEHVARTSLGQRLELAITTLVGEASKPHNETVKVNVIFETRDGVVTGTTDAKVKRVEWQDDGSLTVVIDYWPQPANPAGA